MLSVAVPHFLNPALHNDFNKVAEFKIVICILCRRFDHVKKKYINDLSKFISLR